MSPEQRFSSYVETGNKAILHALIQEYADRSYTQSRRIIGRDDGAEDAVQEAYLLLVRTAKRYDGTVPFAAWLGRLVTSSSLNYRNRMHRYRNLGDGDPGAKAMPSDTIPVSDNEPEIEALRSALDSLPDLYRTPLTLYYFAGLSQTETAAALGAPADRIAKQISRGLEKLRAKLGRAGFAVTTAGLVTVISSLPTYAAPPALKASLAASESLVSVGRHISERFHRAAEATAAKGVGFIQAGMIVALTIGAAIVALQFSSRKPMPTAPPAYPSTSSISELIAHWSFDEGRGTTVTSDAGMRDVGILVNGPTWSTGEAGGRLIFDGIDDFVRVDHRDAFESPSLTVSLRFMNFGVKDDGPKVIQKMEWMDANGWALSLGDSDGLRLTWETIKDGVSYRATSKTVIQENVLYAVAGTYSDGMLRLYINGIPEVMVTGSKGITSDPLYLGCEDGYRSTEPPHMLHGCLEDVRIYNYALSDSEIASLSR
jgi:RNA polymerase sigma factor (sigma-70 family)